ncbi:MAG: sulfatase [Verrucomicrobia bacterium]|nr:sulfatase [Verrucomicrobiota bacterium]
MDTTRADHVVGNDALAPNINALAKRGVLFRNCFTVVPTTLASFTSLFSGMYPHTHGVARNGIPVPQSLELMAERFSARGYVTAGFAASYALHSTHGIAQGFDTYDESFDSSISGGPVQRRADAVNASVFPWLEQHAKDRFFLFVHYFDPHAPYDPPSPFDRAKDLNAPRWEFSSLSRLRQAVRAGNKTFTRQLSDDVRSMYAGEIAFMDSEIGRLVNELEEHGLLENTLIVLVGDHGENLDEREEELFDHGRTVYDEGIHVPLVLSCSSLWPEGRQDERVVRTIDIAPTISILTGMDLSESYEGVSLLDVAGKSQDAQDLVVFSEASKPWTEEAEANPRWQNQNKIKCARSANWKLILDPLSETFSLYDLRAGAPEKQNVFDAAMKSQPDAVRPLMIALEGWMNDLSDNAGGRKTISPEVEKQLRSLGYTR